MVRNAGVAASSVDVGPNSSRHQERELERALRIADRVLNEPYRDPDDDISALGREGETLANAWAQQRKAATGSDPFGEAA